MQVIAGSPLGSGRWCIFAINQGRQISSNLLAFLACLRDTGYDIILVNNGRFPERSITVFLPHCHTIIAKPRGGRDFGGYKWATKHLAEMGCEIKQVIYCNDSIFIRPSALRLMLNRLNQMDDNYIGITETFDPSYHVQSWFFVISGNLFHNKGFGAFWREYRPFSYRLYCVKRGEIGISQYLTRRGITPRPLYSQAMIVELIFDGSLTQAVESILISLGPDEYNALDETVQQITFQQFPDQDVTRSFLKHYFIEKLNQSNTMNAANLVLLERTEFPFLKKDLVYRGRYFVTQIDDALSRWVGEDADHVEEIRAYIRTRGSLRRQYSPSAMLARIGVI
ncbi:MAG TPA: rhamnan synthesis F family protein [Xanthobacteraceae bacterium]|nr:rhamnan synthesis F family protein [Xanthobacteraceae bacterium]